MLVSTAPTERLLMRRRPASSWPMVSWIWLLALARGERVSSTCLTAAKRSSEAARLGETLEDVTGAGVVSFRPPGILVREAERLFDSASDPL